MYEDFRNILILACILGLVIFLLRFMKFHCRQSCSIDWSLYEERYERPLGSVESFAHLGKDIFTPMVSVLGIASKTKLSEEIIKKTLEHLMARHALLGMCVRRNKEGMLHFYHMEKKHVLLDVQYNAKLQDVLDTVRAHDGIDIYNGPLWRTILLPKISLDNKTMWDHNCVLVFIQDHAINDGVGTIELKRDFMFILNELLEGKSIELKTAPCILPQEYYVQLKYGLPRWVKYLRSFSSTLFSFKLVKILGFFLCRLFIRNVFMMYCGVEHTRNPDAAITSKTILQILTAKDTDSLVKACKNNGCTVQGAIQAACNLAIARIISEHGGHLPVSFPTAIPIDMRTRILKDTSRFAGAEYGGMIITNGKYSAKAVNKNVHSIWNIARYSTKCIHTQIKKWKLHIYAHYANPVFTFMYEMGYFSASEILPNYGRSFIPTVVSSLGKYTFTEYPAAKPTGILFSVTAHHMGPVFGTYVVTVNDQMNISHTYYPHISNVELAHLYSNYSLEYLKLLCRDTQ